ncbi:hypothetical protein [Pseudoduganella violaceinigra]|uniref:hypothetical protein n=1 Tax=Pseudoduganella violaceinigra TaxID=246602 RepID=UPI0012B611D1|nr:hypothetical protein [Pseudoduganella violaceinigra]
MKSVFTLMCCVAVAAFAPASQAAGRSASMQVSLTIVESCNVEVTARQQSVQCAYAAPYAISKAAPQAAQPQSSADSNGDSKVVTITF